MEQNTHNAIAIRILEGRIERIARSVEMQNQSIHDFMEQIDTANKVIDECNEEIEQLRQSISLLSQ